MAIKTNFWLGQYVAPRLEAWMGTRPEDYRHLNAYSKMVVVNNLPMQSLLRCLVEFNRASAAENCVVLVIINGCVCKLRSCQRPC